MEPNLQIILNQVRLDFFPAVLLVTLLAIASYYDLRYHIIPNLLTYPAMLMALIYYGVTNGMEGFVFSGEGLLVGLVALMLPYLIGWMGAGDAKLMAAVGSILGPGGAYTVFIFTVIAGLLYALGTIVFSPRRLKAFTVRFFGIITKPFGGGNSEDSTDSQNEKRMKLCYGLAIVAGTAGYLVWQASGNPHLVFISSYLIGG